MLMIVLIKSVPDEQLVRTMDTSTRQINRDHAVISEIDEYSLEAALKLKEGVFSARSPQVISLTLGPENAIGASKKSLQMGADWAIHLCDETFAGLDVSGTSEILALAVQKILQNQNDDRQYLVFTGMESSDGKTAALPFYLAQKLGLPAIGHVAMLAAQDNVLEAQRNADGYIQTFKVPIPALISVSEKMPAPRYPNFKNILAAKKKPLDQWNSTDLETGSLSLKTYVSQLEKNVQRQTGTIVDTAEQAPEDVADQLLEFLKSTGSL